MPEESIRADGLQLAVGVYRKIACIGIEALKGALAGRIKSISRSYSLGGHHQYSNIIILTTPTCLTSIGGHLLRPLAYSSAKNTNLTRTSLVHPSLLSSVLSDSFIVSSCLLMCMASCWLQTAVRGLWAGRAWGYVGPLEGPAVDVYGSGST